MITNLPVHSFCCLTSWRWPRRRGGSDPPGRWWSSARPRPPRASPTSSCTRPVSCAQFPRKLYIFNDKSISLNCSYFYLVRSPHQHAAQQQRLAVDLGDVRELGEVDSVAHGEPLALAQQESLLHDGGHLVDGGAVEDESLLGRDSLGCELGLASLELLQKTIVLVVLDLLDEAPVVNAILQSVEPSTPRKNGTPNGMESV